MKRKPAKRRKRPLSGWRTEPAADRGRLGKAEAEPRPHSRLGPGRKRAALIPISHHPDQIVAVTRGYGAGQKPEDFLDSFTAFVSGNINKIAALNIVVQRPRDLTRAELKALRLALDALGYSEANLRRAWSDAKNEDIAASIIGFVRQAALGDALTPFDVRVRAAMQRILARKPMDRSAAEMAEAHRGAAHA